MGMAEEEERRVTLRVTHWRMPSQSVPQPYQLIPRIFAFMSTSNPDVRWIQRFEHFDKATTNLCAAVDMDVSTMSLLEKEGMIQRFEVAVELGWKTLRDYLENEGHAFTEVTPKAVIKSAFGSGVLLDGQVWIDMIDQRNALAHVYDEEMFEKAIEAIAGVYAPAIEGLQIWLRTKKGSQWQRLD